MPLTSLFSEQSHRRWNPLQESWVLVSPHRAKRPWQGAVEKTSCLKLPQYLPDCYLCPGNIRSNGARNPSYTGTFVFSNDFAALSDQPEDSTGTNTLDGIIQVRPERGLCRVVCFSPRHDLTLADLDVAELRGVIDVWATQYAELSGRPEINNIMTFENKGAIMGCSNPHPHGQIWATSSIPNLALTAANAQKKFFAQKQQVLLKSYVDWELDDGSRTVAQNEDWLAVVPFWAVWPYEVMVLPRRPVATIAELTAQEKNSWAAILKVVTKKFDGLFECSFPYSMGIYQKPCDDQAWPGFMLHQVFLPPLLRSASVRKFMVGYELCGEPQRDITPESAAARLRGE